MMFVSLLLLHLFLSKYLFIRVFIVTGCDDSSIKVLFSLMNFVCFFNLSANVALILMSLPISNIYVCMVKITLLVHRYIFCINCI